MVVKIADAFSRLVWALALGSMLLGLSGAESVPQALYAVVMPYCVARAVTMLLRPPSRVQEERE